MSWLPCAQATLEEGAGGALVELALLLSADIALSQLCHSNLAWKALCGDAGESEGSTVGLPCSSLLLTWCFGSCVLTMCVC